MIVDVPYFYHAEVLLPKKRKSSLIHIMDHMPVEIAEDDGDLSVVALNVKKQWDSENGEQKKKLVSVLFEHKDRLLSPVNMYNNAYSQNMALQIPATPDIISLIPETTSLSNYETVMRENITKENLPVLFQIISEQMAASGFVTNLHKLYHLPEKPYKVRAFNEIPDIKEWVSDNKTEVQDNIRKQFEAKNYIIINNKLYKDAPVPLYTLDAGVDKYAPGSSDLILQVTQSKKLSWTAFRNDQTFFHFPITYMGNLNDMNNYLFDGVRIKKGKENNGDTYILDMEALQKHTSTQDLLNVIMTMLPPSKIVFKTDDGDFDIMSNHPVVKGILSGPVEMDGVLAYMDILKSYEESFHDITETNRAHVIDKCNLYNDCTLLYPHNISQKIKNANFITHLISEHEKIPVQDLQAIELQKEYKPNPHYQKFLAARSRYRF